MNKLFRHFLFVLLPVLSMLAVSCNDDDVEEILAPDISAVSPTEGLPGTAVTITGTNLANATSIMFGNTEATATNNTATSITTTVPATAAAGSQPIKVVTAGGSDTFAFTVLEEGPEPATITAVNPATGVVGDEVVITGTNFTGATSVRIGETEIQGFQVSEDGNTITFTVPEGATAETFTGRFTVTTPAGDVTSAEDVMFTLEEADETVTITAVQPNAGGVGTEVTITGANFTGATALRIGETEIVGFEVNEAGDAITFTVPENATAENFTGRFTVVTPEGEITSAENVIFTFGEPEPEDYTNTLAHLPFNGDAEDATENANNATLVGDATFGDGIAGQGLVLSNGTGMAESYATLPNGIFEGVEEATISTYVKLDSKAAWTRVWDFGTGQDVNAFLTVQAGGTDAVRFAIKNGEGTTEEQINPTAGGVLNVGEWYHIAVTIKGNVGVLYLNGEEIGRNETMTLNLSDLESTGGTTQNYIGKAQYPDPLLNGVVDEFRIYDIALTAEQIEELASLLP